MTTKTIQPTVKRIASTVLTDEEKAQIQAINESILDSISNGNGKRRVTAKEMRDVINPLYFKYIYPIDSKRMGYSLIELEKKADRSFRVNEIKLHLVLHLVHMPMELDAKQVLQTLSFGREAFNILTTNIYE